MFLIFFKIINRKKSAGWATNTIHSKRDHALPLATAFLRPTRQTTREANTVRITGGGWIAAQISERRQTAPNKHGVRLGDVRKCAKMGQKNDVEVIAGLGRSVTSPWHPEAPNWAQQSDPKHRSAPDQHG